MTPSDMTHPKRFSPGWFLRLPLMLKRKRDAGIPLAFASKSKTSYAQFGEDIVADSVFWHLRIPKPLYLDIGAYDPKFLSNTYYFYKKGSSGVCVEPDPARRSAFRRIRPRDLCLSAGVGAADKDAVPFYVLSEPSLSTFDQKNAQQHEAAGKVQIRSVISVPVYSINTLIEQHLPRCPDFLSVDVEGIDLEILQAMDFDRFRPAVICVETIDFYTQAKQLPVVDFLQTQGYRVQADTVINTILVDEQAWAAHQ